MAEGSGTAKAIDYSETYSHYADSGHLPRDNNGVESCIRPRRAGCSPAWSAAWLKDILEKLPAWPNSRLDELLPLRRA